MKYLNKYMGLAALTLPFSFVQSSDYSFVTPDKAIHLEGSYRQIAKAKIAGGAEKGTHLHYADSTDAIFLSHYLNPHNALSWELGYSYLNLNWKENPRFKETNYNYANTSLALISTSMDYWRWILNASASVDAHSFSFGNTGVYGGFIWGRRQITEALAGHIGAYGFSGVKNSSVLPILGIDYAFGNCWELHAIFPIDFSIEYVFHKKWSTEVAYAVFGGPYHFPRRARSGTAGFENGIFEVYSKGVEWDLNYNCNQRFNPQVCDQLINATIGIGWNFGGWMLVKDSQSQHGSYYKFNAAPYAQAELSITF